MFTSIIESVLLHHVGKYLSGLEKNSFNVGLIDGEITIDNIGLNNTLFDELEIPLTLKFSNIQKIHIEVPWTKLDEKPTTVNIEGIDILLDLSELKSLSESTIAFKFEQIISKIRKDLEAKVETKEKAEKKDKKEEGFAERSLIRILDNVDVTLRNLHVRFEDNSSFGSHHFSFGVTLKELKFHTTNSGGNKEFYKRNLHKKAVNPPLLRELKAMEIKAYWNSDETVFIKDIVQADLPKALILQFMKLPLPAMREPLGKSMSVGFKKESDFFKELFKTRDEKEKEKVKESKEKIQWESYQHTLSQMKFHPICDLMVTAEITQNDFGQKDQPLIDAKLWIQPIKLEVEEIMISQLLCLLQYYLKYTQDLFYYHNKTKGGAMGNEAEHRKGFNAVMQYIFKKLPKTKNMAEITKSCFKNKEDKEAFENILNLQSVKNLRNFAEDFVVEMKLKKQIEKTEKNIKNKEKAAEEIKRLMEKTRGKEEEEVIDLDESGRVLVSLNCSLGALSVKINQQKHSTVLESIRLSLPLTQIQLSFVSTNNIEATFSSNDLFLEYSAGHTYVVLHQNQLKQDDLVTVQFKKKGRLLTLNAKILKKEFMFPQNLLAFVIKFIEPIHITPFFLNLFQQSTNIDSETARDMINTIMELVPNLKSTISIELPKVELKLKHTGVVIDLGSLTIEIPEEGFKSVPINLKGLMVEIISEEQKTTLLPKIEVNTLILRETVDEENVDSIKIELERVEVTMPEVDIFDKLATEMFQMTKDILKKELHLIDRKRISLHDSVTINSNPLVQNLSIVGELIEISSNSSKPTYIVLYQTNVYPLIHNNKYYVVLLKKRKVNYIQVESEEAMHKLVEGIVDHVESLSTINQLKNIWFIDSKYETTFKSVCTDVDKFLTFICESETHDNLQREIDVILNVRQVVAKFAEIVARVEDVRFKHTEYNIMWENKLSVKSVDVKVKEEKFLYILNDENNFIQLSTTKIISQKVELTLQGFGLSITNENIVPLLQSVSEIMKTTILREALTLNASISQVQTSRELFNLLELESHIKIEQFQCSVMDCAGFIAENLLLKLRVENNSQEVLLLVSGMDIFEMVKFSDLEVRRVFLSTKENTLDVKYKSLLLELSPELLLRYMVILQSNKDYILSHYETVIKLVEFAESTSYLAISSASNEKISVIGSNTEVQFVETEDNIVVISIPETIVQLNLCNNLTHYTLSLMEISAAQQKSNNSLPLVKKFGVILKYNQKGQKNLVSLAITKLEVQLGMYVVEYLYKMAKALHTIFLRNQWVLKFAGGFIKEMAKEVQLTTGSPEISLNLQVDEATVLYMRKDSTPYLKLRLKVSKSNLQLGASANVQLVVETSLLYLNNEIKIFQPIVQPVELEVSYTKNSRMESLKVTSANFKLGVSSESIRETILAYKEIQEFVREHTDSFNEIINTIDRIKNNKTLMIEKEDNRFRSRSKVKEDFNKGFTIRTFKEPHTPDPTNYLRVVNCTGTTVGMTLSGHNLKVSCSLERKQEQVIPIKIKNEYKNNYEILERVQHFKIIIEIDKHQNEATFTLNKLISHKIELPQSKEVRLKAILDTEGITILIASKMKIINETPQRFLVKVGINFEEEIAEHSEVYLPYYTEDIFKIGMLSSSSVGIKIPEKEGLQELEFVTFSGDYHTILLTTEIKQNEHIFRLMDSMRIFNYFDFQLEIRLGDTGLVLTPNNSMSTSKASLKGITNIELSIPTVGKWISVPIAKLSEHERELSYPLDKEEIKVYVIMSHSKLGRIIHIYPRLVIINMTPYKLTLYVSLYESLFVVNKRLKDSVERPPQSYKGFTIDYQPEEDYFVLDDERYLHLAFSQTKHMSEEFVGYESDFNQTVELKDDNHTYHFKITYEQIRLTEKVTIFKTTVKPKFYFINKSEHSIKVNDWTIQPNHLIAYAFSRSSTTLRLSMDYEGTNYSLINSVELHVSNRWSLLLVQQSKKDDTQSHESHIYNDFEVLRFGVELIFKDGFGYFIFSNNTDYIVVSNKLKDKTLQALDHVEIKLKFQLMPGERRKYYPIGPLVEMQVLGSESELVEEISLDINLVVNKELSFCSVNEYFEHSDRVIVFGDTEEESVELFNEDHGRPLRMLSLNIGEISVSFVFYTFDEVRSEVLFNKILDVQLLRIDYERVNMVEFKCLSLSLISKELNQIVEIVCGQTSAKEFINLYLELPKDCNTILKCKLDVSPIKVCISDELIELVLFNVDKLGLLKDERDNLARKEKQFQSLFALYNRTREEKEVDKVLWKVVNLEIGEIILEVEFKKCYVKGNKKRLKSFGFSLAELKTSGLRLSKLEINHSQQAISDFSKAIANSYKREIISMIGGVLGGLSILGNPKEFILEIETSVRQSNPGIIRGTGGFFKGVAVGAINSVSKITGVMGNGLNLLSLDEKYMEERQEIKNKSMASARDGLVAGASSFYKGLESGITGLVTQPARGLEEEGIFGIFKGSLKGVVGLFTKPVIGAIDATSMAAGSLAFKTKSSKSQVSTHQRIRPLYFQRRIMRQQCDVEETCCLFLHKYFPQFYLQMKLVQTFLLQAEDDPATLTSILVVSLSELTAIDILSHEVLLKVENQKLSAVGKFSEGVALYYVDDEDEEMETVLRLKRSNELKHLLYLTLHKVVETFKVETEPMNP